VFLGRGNPGVNFIDDRAGIRPLVLDMRDVGGEHDVAGADMVALFDSDFFVLDGEVDVLAERNRRAGASGV
jgi:hypothetical protein